MYQLDNNYNLPVLVSYRKNQDYKDSRNLLNPQIHQDIPMFLQGTIHIRL
jgi:hypothetical protein